jgi:hypothetical protein
MIPADAAPDDEGNEPEIGGQPEIGGFLLGDDPVGDNAFTWLLNDLLSLDAGEDLLGGCVALVGPDERELARAVDAVELPEDVLDMARLVPPPIVPVPLGLVRPWTRASGRGIASQDWTRPDQPISVATDEARSFWRRPRKSLPLRVAVAATVMSACGAVGALSWQALSTIVGSGHPQVVNGPPSYPRPVQDAGTGPRQDKQSRPAHLRSGSAADGMATDSVSNTGAKAHLTHFTKVRSGAPSRAGRRRVALPRPTHTGPVPPSKHGSGGGTGPAPQPPPVSRHHSNTPPPPVVLTDFVLRHKRHHSHGRWGGDDSGAWRAKHHHHHQHHGRRGDREDSRGWRAGDGSEGHWRRD